MQSRKYINFQFNSIIQNKCPRFVFIKSESTVNRKYDYLYGGCVDAVPTRVGGFYSVETACHVTGGFDRATQILGQH